MASLHEIREATYAEWLAEAEELFGKDPMNWRFVCPVCGHVAAVRDYKDAGAPSTAAGFSCVGRWLPDSKDAMSHDGESGGPCNYAGGGLFRMNPVRVKMADGKISETFEFDRTEGNRSRA